MAQEENIQQTSQTTEKKQRSNKYHLMLFVDTKSGEIKQMGIGQLAVEIAAGIILLMIISLFIGWRITANEAKTAAEENAKLNAQVEELAIQVSTLESTNSELESKVAILSDTVTTKVKEENKQQAIDEAAHIPSGFPISSSASYETEEEDENFMIFTVSSGSNIQAAAAGTVIEVSAGEGYTHLIVIDHGNGYISKYYNNGDVMVKENDQVIQGSVLYVVGEDNLKMGYRILKDEKSVNPLELISIDG